MDKSHSINSDDKCLPTNPVAKGRFEPNEATVKPMQPWVGGGPNDASVSTKFMIFLERGLAVIKKCIKRENFLPKSKMSDTETFAFQAEISQVSSINFS